MNRYSFIVFITHSIDEALTLSTRMAVMGSKPGRIVQDIHNATCPIRAAPTCSCRRASWN